MIKDTEMLNYIKDVLENMPKGWLSTTTHRLDIYNEKLAKTEFLEQLEKLYKDGNADTAALSQLPTAYDYIRLGHPLSCVLEWAIAKLINQPAENIISFSSQVTPILAILRTNLLKGKNSKIVYRDQLPDCFTVDTIKRVYGYQFEVEQLEETKEFEEFDGSVILLSNNEKIDKKIGMSG